MKRHGAGPGPRVRAPAGVAIRWEGTAYKVELDTVRAEHAEWCFGPGLRALQAFRWMAGNLGLANNRRERRKSESAAQAFERADEATAAARRAYVVANWSEFERQLERHQWALTEANAAYMRPFAQIGKKVDDGVRARVGVRDHADFLELARLILKRKPGLLQSELAKEREIADYVAKYPDDVLKWFREVYPDRPVGRPRKK